MIEWLKHFLVVSFLLNVSNVCTGQECMTDDEGPVKNSPCVFPFMHYGKFYKGCTKDRDLAGKFWCWYYKTFFFTIFDTAGETTIIFPLQAGQGLILKFVDKEEIKFYNFDTRCSTQVDRYRKHINGNWGYCNLKIKGKLANIFILIVLFPSEGRV
jgi:hypothetical protein